MYDQEKKKSRGEKKISYFKIIHSLTFLKFFNILSFSLHAHVVIYLILIISNANFFFLLIILI